MEFDSDGSRNQQQAEWLRPALVVLDIAEYTRDGDESFTEGDSGS